MATDIMARGGVPPATYLALRYGGHSAAALWCIVAAWPAGRGIRWVGLLYALDLGSYSFLAASGVSFVVLVPSAVLLPLWLALVGRHLALGRGVAARPPVEKGQRAGDAGFWQADTRASESGTAYRNCVAIHKEGTTRWNYQPLLSNRCLCLPPANGNAGCWPPASSSPL